ncbi:hypothetical protein [Phytomonospora endophytica]|uniref:Uncharacterized protein n=1 Tax=Phytomonospora endophytica TaxID=714109 RepID=A0A841FF82_9ACTN|nr:hypothetical protein [Phytomonospora endophytica]MBB6035971.1 hypothetical protein [Phytomonospora endophytica]GIG66877.1 hypothetical protein Pen01_31720 [Phytomonospora endophytica]
MAAIHARVPTNEAAVGWEIVGLTLGIGLSLAGLVLAQPEGVALAVAIMSTATRRDLRVRAEPRRIRRPRPTLADERPSPKEFRHDAWTTTHRDRRAGRRPSADRLRITEGRGDPTAVVCSE